MKYLEFVRPVPLSENSITPISFDLDQFASILFSISPFFWFALSLVTHTFEGRSRFANLVGYNEHTRLVLAFFLLIIYLLLYLCMSAVLVIFSRRKLICTFKWLWSRSVADCRPPHRFPTKWHISKSITWTGQFQLNELNWWLLNHLGIKCVPRGIPSNECILICHGIVECQLIGIYRFNFKNIHAHFCKEYFFSITWALFFSQFLILLPPNAICVFSCIQFQLLLYFVFLTPFQAHAQQTKCKLDKNKWCVQYIPACRILLFHCICLFCFSFEVTWEEFQNAKGIIRYCIPATHIRINDSKLAQWIRRRCIQI